MLWQRRRSEKKICLNSDYCFLPFCFNYGTSLCISEPCNLKMYRRLDMNQQCAVLDAYPKSFIVTVLPLRLMLPNVHKGV